MDDKQNIDNLAKYIKFRGYTQKWVYSQLQKQGVGLNYSHFNRICNGWHKPKHRFIARELAKILNTTEELILSLIKSKTYEAIKEREQGETL